MFGQVNETEFDLRFSLFRIPVRVHPGFWLMAVIMGSRLLQEIDGLMLVAIWVAVVFISILVHEMGHALAVRYFRWEPHIVLYHFGGYAAYHPPWGQTHWQSIFISFAGPGAGFLLYGIVRLFEFWYVQDINRLNWFVLFAIYQLKYVNLWWGLINLLPVLPLDGGRIAGDVFQLSKIRQPWDWTFKTGMLVSGATAAYFLMHYQEYGLYPGILFGFLFVTNLQMFQQQGRGGIW